MPKATVLRTRFRCLAASMLLGAAGSGCLADIGKHPEASLEVQVYRALEKEFLQSASGKTLLEELAKTRCARSPVSAYNYAPTESDTRVREMDAAAGKALPCNQHLYGVCGYANITGPRPFSSTWASTMKGVAFRLYMVELVRMTGMQVPELERALQALAERDVQDIAARLSGTEADPKAAAFKGLYREGDYGELEASLAKKWNGLVLALPESRRHEVPLLLFGGGMCHFLLGDPFEVRTEPSGATVSLILDFDWLLCQALGRDPWNQSDCPGWFVLASPGHRLLGTYRYEAKWPGRPVSRNTIRTEGAVGKVLVLR
ncbi:MULTISPECIES: hypothetical protein [unclassified Variovorax]|uniref:hypothetical protein n=1 Tax=unclassified Variovorax TaxID=663243 RepID=UPI000A3DDBF4|nr:MULTISPECIES: hypothetical protein [unclassified Variovorax]PNG50207.1 hypothetical protein CHC06_05830 [Variovorax sp. B2]PNG51080.1 hypothetical protein CHC07_05736 [Variovorax sp. B4]VTU42340.1 hypothetical protein SRS16P1_00245 [Variovorax sp. SRS16]VTU42365.1 hypothetical protein E5P1_00243 [Variovorax sp. PBL-E5]VTU44158.1 hypothetical protein H6P1_00686 [Variovorax sp. PBL-H6]